jgi:hypothetical protein
LNFQILRPEKVFELIDISLLFSQLSYHEVDTNNGDRDTNSIIKEETSTRLDSLLPGRNYSITVHAISNFIESNGTSIYQATSGFANF